MHAFIRYEDYINNSGEKVGPGFRYGREIIGEPPAQTTELRNFIEHKVVRFNDGDEWAGFVVCS